jgi:UPF0176 protein
VFLKRTKGKIISGKRTPHHYSFYQYFDIKDPQVFRDELYLALNKLGVFGRIYIAHEGINAQLSVPQSTTKHLKRICMQLSR